MTRRNDAHEGCTCERCVNWLSHPGHLVVMPYPNAATIFQIGLCIGDESDHFGHLVVNEHPACEKLDRRQEVPK